MISLIVFSRFFQSLLAIAVFFLGFVSLVFAQSSDTQTSKVIYKWRENGIVYYSAFRPKGVKQLTILDAYGAKLANAQSVEQSATKELVLRPSNEQTRVQPRQTEQQQVGALNNEAKQKNCQLARKNLTVLQDSEVYEYAESGELVRLRAEQITTRKKQAQKDIDYFCQP